MSYNLEVIYELHEELQKYIDIDGTEIGEACSALVNLSRYPDYISEECLVAVVKEMQTQLEMFKELCTIVETEETYTHKVVDLVWK
jgi:L-fucose mutarotase/ribose pyranase (RbsD/FucU family)